MKLLTVIGEAFNVMLAYILGLALIWMLFFLAANIITF